MNLAQLFTIPIWESPFPDFDIQKELFLQATRSFREKNPEGLNRYNTNAYQSPINMTHVSELSPIYDFAAQIGIKAAFDLQLVNCDTFITAAWVNYHDTQNGMQVEHTHQDTFSGVIYLKAPKKSGHLVINNPALNSLWQGTMLVSKKNKFTADRIRIAPQEGNMLIWPSYLPHSVETNNHDEERISIGFNILCVPKEHVDHTK